MSEDREQIVELMAGYGWACDTRDWDLLRRSFLPDAVVRYSSFGGELRGHDALERYLRDALAALDATQHLFTNFVVECHGERGSFRCLLQAQHVKGSALFTVGGTYDADVERTADGWRIGRLRFAPTWMSGDPQVLEHILEPGAAP